MKVSDAFPSRFLKGEQLPGPVDVVIAAVKQERAYLPGEGQAPVFVLYVVNGSKGVCMSRGLARQIAEILNDEEMNNWAGKRVQLFPQAVQVAGKSIITVRARAAAAVPAGTNGHKSIEQEAADLEESMKAGEV